MMKIESIRIQGYRSLADFTFKPQPFTVLVGPNNAGKSNIIDALDFIGDVYRSGVKLAIERKGGFENIAYRKDGIPVQEMSFEVVLSAPLAEAKQMAPPTPQEEAIETYWEDPASRLRFTHRFSTQGVGESLISDFKVMDEEIEIGIASGEFMPIFRISRIGRSLDFSISPSRKLSWLVLPFFGDEVEAERFVTQAARMDGRPRELFLDQLRTISPLPASFTASLASIRTYQFLPSVCSRPAAMTATAEIGPNGENLAALIEQLKSQFPEPWDRVLESMALMMPGLDDIEVRAAERRWRLFFKEADGNGIWTADEVSDGTVRALALFATVNDPRASTLALEEPENSLHPWILRVLAEACRNQADSAEAKQIVLTTHSPVLIDWLDPAELAIVWKERGQTRLQPFEAMEPGLRSSWERGELKLSSVLDSGLVREAVPVP